MRNSDAQLEFFATSAQVIPVFIVALVADANRFRQRATSSGSFVVAMVLGVLAEATALSAIWRNESGHVMRIVLWVSMAWMGLIMLVPHLGEHVRLLHASFLDVPPRVRRLATGIGLGVIGVLVLVYVVPADWSPFVRVPLYVIAIAAGLAAVAEYVIVEPPAPPRTPVASPATAAEHFTTAALSLEAIARELREAGFTTGEFIRPDAPPDAEPDAPPEPPEGAPPKPPA
jgi:hypothetical protein